MGGIYSTLKTRATKTKTEHKKLECQKKPIYSLVGVVQVVS